MCNKKGFTLIELLATIVVIAIVSLISVPVVVNIIEKANLASFKRSAESIRRISKNYYTNNSLEYQDFDNIYFDCNNSECISNFNGVKYKNLGASGSMGNGYVKIYDEGDIEFLLSNGKYCAEKNISSDTIKYYKGTCEGLVIDLDKIKINSIETISTTSTITVRGDVTAGKSGVAQYEFYIDNELKYIEETTDTNYTYTFTKVSGKNHTIKVKVYNGTHGKPNEDLNSSSDEKEINASLLDFENIKIIPSTTEWASSKTYTISGTTAGATLQYKLVSGTTVKQDWTNYSGDITVNWTSTTTNPTYIYARFNDGVNTSDEKTNIETKIDTTAPVLTLGTATPTTKSITIPITVNKDDESGIKSTKCEYGTSTSYGNIGTISGNSCVINNVKNNTKYYYKVATTNNAGLSTVKTGSNETGQFGAITIVSSSTEWASSKTYTISGTTTGATLQYKVVSGTTVKQDWTNYSGDITVNWTSTITTPTYIYARFNDGTNTSDEKTYIETKIDTTAPVATVVYKTADGQVYESDNWTNQSVTAYLSAIDNESGLDHYQMTYDGATWIDIAGDTFTFENSGRTGMWFRAVDKVGNIGGQTTTYLISIDKTNPTITYNYNAQSTINWYGGEYYMGCFNGGITPTLTLADTGGSGLSSNNQIAIWKDGTWINNAVSIGNNQWNIPMAEEGRYIPHIIARDNAGNVSQGTRPATDENHLTVWEIDTSTPTMSVNFNGYTPGTWTNGNIAISLSGSNSGCDTTKNYYYSINDGEWVHFGTGDTATYNITSDANYNIKFVVTDGWGRWGTLTQNYSIKRDTIKPTVSYSLAGGTYSTNQIVRITPSDANYSSMAVHVYKNSALVYSGKVDEKSTDGTSALYYDVALDSDGTWTIYTTVYDKAGNTQNQSPNNGWWYYQEYTISTTKLQVLNGLNIDNGWVGDANNINLQANCPSGVTNYVFDIYDLNYPDRIATTKTVGSTATSITYLFTSNLSEMTYPFPATDHYGQPITINQKFKGSLKINLSCKNASGTTIASTSRTVQIDTTPVLSLYSANATTTSFDAVISIKNLGSGINHVYYAKGHGTTESLDNGTSTTRTFTGFTSCSYHYITAHVINNVGLTGSISTYLWTEGCSGGSGSGTCSCSTAQSILKCVSDNGTNCGGDSRTAASILQSCKSQGITCSY